jgi:TetR/AcrR family transcriptional regulator, tetracycline repressor protein
MTEGGTVVARRRKDGLTRARVLDAALALADQDGLGGVSMRRVAAGLGVEAMSLYNHVASKADLLDGMASRVFEDITLPDPALAWQERVRALGHSCHAVFRAHPAVVQAITAGQADPRSAGALRIIDAILGAFLDAGFGTHAAVRGYRVLLDIVFGSVLLEAAGSDEAAGDGGPAEPVADWFRRNVTEAELPHLHRSLPAMAGAGCEQDFGYELELLIAGLQARARVAARPG